ncbi:hypothetical protein HRbin35_00440 [bacterium HR35]|nr:hypothetical protein HRbin35_00440 [bacterium HR35]
MKKGFTLIEMLIVIFLLMTILSLTLIVIKPFSYFQRSRDLKRMSDLKALEIAINTYLNVTSTPVLGPNSRGVGEASSSVFISVPYDKEDVRNSLAGGFYIYQVSSINLNKIDGTGWLPINFSVLIYPPLNSLPIDPINYYSKKYFYSYVFNRASSTYEINANLESAIFKNGGSNDKTSTDGGNNPNIFEVGNDKNLMNSVY